MTNTHAERLARLNELDAKRTQGEWRSRERWVGTPNHMSFIAECRDQNGNWTREPMPLANADFIAHAPQMAALIAQLWDEREQITEALKVRSKQIGVACLKHDLTHALACGHCYAQQDATIQQQREVMRMARGQLQATNYCGDNDSVITALDAALNELQLSPIDKAALAESIIAPPEPSEKLIAALGGE